MATIIFLNGVGSAGKSSIAKALQAIASEPFLHVAMDAFLDMMPARYWDHPDGVTFETVRQDGKPSVVSRRDGARRQQPDRRRRPDRQ